MSPPAPGSLSSQEGVSRMDALILLARFIAPLFVAVGLAVLLDPTQDDRVLESSRANSELHDLSGAVAFVIRTPVILYHNLWIAGWRVMIAIIGWISLIEGVVRIRLPAIGARLAGSLLASKWSLDGMAVPVLAAGAWLSDKGFLAN